MFVMCLLVSLVIFLFLLLLLVRGRGEYLVSVVLFLFVFFFFFIFYFHRKKGYFICLWGEGFIFCWSECNLHFYFRGSL